MNYTIFVSKNQPFCPDLRCNKNILYAIIKADYNSRRISKKPAYDTIKNLIKNKWHTETESVTNSNGKASFKGFYGEYDLEITLDGKTISKTINLSKNGIKEFTMEV